MPCRCWCHQHRPGQGRRTGWVWPASQQLNTQPTDPPLFNSKPLQSRNCIDFTPNCNFSDTEYGCFERKNKVCHFLSHFNGIFSGCVKSKTTPPPRGSPVHGLATRGVIAQQHPGQTGLRHLTRGNHCSHGGKSGEHNLRLSQVTSYHHRSTSTIETNNGWQQQYHQNS